MSARDSYYWEEAKKGERERKWEAGGGEGEGKGRRGKFPESSRVMMKEPLNVSYLLSRVILVFNLKICTYK